jgi:putative ABC transport system permease protein
MGPYAKKLLREVGNQKGLTISVAAVTGLGVFLFLVSASSYLDLRDSYAATRRKLALADLQIDLSRVTPRQVAAIAALPEVATAESRIVTTVPANLDRSRVALRVLSLPDAKQPLLDRVLLLSGDLPDGNGEVLLEKHFATYHGLLPGDTVEVRVPGFSRRLLVSGVAVSAEYLWVTRDASDIFPSPDAFGVAWMSRGSLASLAQAVIDDSPKAAAALPGLSISAAVDDGNQLLVARTPATSAAALEAAIRAVLGSDVLAAVPQDQLPGVRLLQMDVDGYKGMAGFFPVFFLGVAGFILASILGRLIDSQRVVIGTLSALGVGRGRVLSHYLAFALLLSALGSVSGAGLGLAFGPMLTHEYAKELSIPFVNARLHLGLAVSGIAVGGVVALLAGWLPALRASRMAPAESMRPAKPFIGWLARATRHLGLPLSVRLAMRDLFGRPLRSMGTMLGIAAALILVITSGSMVDSFRTTLTVLFSDAQRYDLRVDLVAPEPPADLAKQMGALDGVDQAEAVLTVPVTVTRGNARADAVLQGLTTGSEMLRSVDSDGRLVPPGRGGVVLPRLLARKIGAQLGDSVNIRTQPEGLSSQFRVNGLADGAMGPTVSVRIEDVSAAFGVPAMATSAVVRAKVGKLNLVRDALSSWPGAAHVQDLAAIRAQVDALMGFGWVMLGTMLAFSVVLAAAILFNTATLEILERRREIATLRALGRSMREVAAGLTLEHGLLAVAGLAVGFPLALMVAHKVLALFQSDLFALPFVVSPATFGATALGVVAVLLLAQWPALRQISRSPVAQDVRTYEG